MSNEVYANFMEISCKQGSGKAICAFPDVCFTPPQTPATPPGVPIPYPNTGMDSDTTDGTSTVKVSGQEAMLKNKSCFKKSTGDEAGAAPKKGFVTSKNTGKVYFNVWSMDVKFEGENVVRNLDLTTHNHASFPGDTPTWPYLSKASVANPKGACAAEVKKIETACAGVSDPCAGMGASKPSRRKKSKTAFNLAAKTAANDCLAARRCALQTYSPNTCCPPQTPHHLIEASALFDKGRGGKGSTPLEGISNYKENDAPCVCAEGPTQNVGTHGLMHSYQSAVASSCPDGKLTLEGGKTINAKTTTYSDAKTSAHEAMKKVFPDSKCSKKCIDAQLDNYHRQCGIRNDTEIKAVKTGSTDLSAADSKRAELEEAVKARRSAGSF
ncbi:MAG: HNH/endonuclease VII fold toxin-2 domain-containing protein [Leptothrix sp. (in: b-proteobacteria)]